jgi:TPR repeat protein
MSVDRRDTIASAARRAADRLAPLLERRLQEVEGPDWLAAVNSRRVAAGLKPGRGLQDHRFCLSVLGYDAATKGWAAEQWRSRARKLNALANKAAHDEPLTAADADEAERIADLFADSQHKAQAAKPAAQTERQLVSELPDAEQREAWYLYRRASEPFDDVEAEISYLYRRAADRRDNPAKCKLGDLHWQQGRLQQAEIWYRRAADEGVPYAEFHLGRLLQQQGRLQEGEIWYRRAADRDVAEVPGLAAFNLGQLLQQQGRLQEAERWLRQAAAAGIPGAAGKLANLTTRGDGEKRKWWRLRASGR